MNGLNQADHRTKGQDEHTEIGFAVGRSGTTIEGEVESIGRDRPWNRLRARSVPLSVSFSVPSISVAQSKKSTCGADSSISVKVHAAK